MTWQRVRMIQGSRYPGFLLWVQTGAPIKQAGGFYVSSVTGSATYLRAGKRFRTNLYATPYDGLSLVDATQVELLAEFSDEVIPEAIHQALREQGFSVN